MSNLFNQSDGSAFYPIKTLEEIQIQMEEVDDESRNCSICFNTLEKELATTTCGHVFHHECITKALSYRKICPICRKPQQARSILKLYVEFSSSSDNNQTLSTATVGELENSDKSSEELRLEAIKLSRTVEKLKQQVELKDKKLKEDGQHFMEMKNQIEELDDLGQELTEELHEKQESYDRMSLVATKRQGEIYKLTKQLDKFKEMGAIFEYFEKCQVSHLHSKLGDSTQVIAALDKACQYRAHLCSKAEKEKATLKRQLDRATEKEKALLKQVVDFVDKNRETQRKAKRALEVEAPSVGRPPKKMSRISESTIPPTIPNVSRLKRVSQSKVLKGNVRVDLPKQTQSFLTTLSIPSTSRRLDSSSAAVDPSLTRRPIPVGLGNNYSIMGESNKNAFQISRRSGTVINPRQRPVQVQVKRKGISSYFTKQ